MEDTTLAPTRVWWDAARPRTLPASIAPVLVGTAASVRVGAGLSQLRVGAFVLALVVALALQIAVNFANDYFDGVRGIDTEARVGPRRAVASGQVAPATMRLAMLGMLGIAAAGGLALAAMAGWELLLVGVAALAATVGYSGGPRPYASAGFGEVFVFVFFGLVATTGSAYVQDEALTWLPVVAAVPMGLLAAALLVVNNLRDIPTDRAAGKVTLAVRLGETATRHLYQGLIGAAYLVSLGLTVATGHRWYLLPWLTAPLAANGLTIVSRAPLGPRLIAALGATGRLHLAFAVLLAVALLLGGAT